QYAPILKDLEEAHEANGEFSKPGLPFTIVDGLLYNQQPDGALHLCVPRAMTKTLLEEAHDAKHHFGPDRMLHALQGLWIHKKTSQSCSSPTGTSPRASFPNRDRKFTSALWNGMWEALGTRLMMTTAYHPQADGLAERKNQTVEIAIRFHKHSHPGSDWLELLPALQWNLNSAYSTPIESSPDEQLFGFKLRGPLDVITGQDGAQLEIAQRVTALKDHLREDARLAMDFAAAAAKRRYDSKHKPVYFEVGDTVYLRLHKGYSLPGKPPRKYSQQRSGPWKVVRKVDRLAYELNFPESSRVHLVVSVAHLSPTPEGKDPFGREEVTPGPVQDEQGFRTEDGELYELERVADHKKNKSGSYKYFVKWIGYGNEHNVWKTERQLRNAKDLVDYYWKRHNERNAEPEATREAPAPKRNRGMPRK
ncbi:hypothetical protein V8F33_002411, partial [Rhypophila sp. PSN 637]